MDFASEDNVREGLAPPLLRGEAPRLPARAIRLLHNPADYSTITVYALLCENQFQNRGREIDHG